jgi:hypothetical protein
MWLASLIRLMGDGPCSRVAGKPCQAIRRSPVRSLLRMLGVSCRLLGEAAFVEESAAAIDAVLLLVRPAVAVTVMTKASLSKQLDKLQAGE